MQSAELKIQYVSHMGDDLTPVRAARISFDQTSTELTERDRKLIKYLADHEHLSVFEHQVLTVIVHCPLYIRSQWHRHRTQSYNEVSRRYTAENIEFYIPPVDDIRAQAKSNKQASEGVLDEDKAAAIRCLMIDFADEALRRYNALVAGGMAREQARAILPQNLMTRFYATANLRNWAHFLKLRLDPHAQKEIRVLAEQVAALIEARFPVSYAALLARPLP